MEMEKFVGKVKGWCREASEVSFRLHGKRSYWRLKWNGVGNEVVVTSSRGLEGRFYNSPDGAPSLVYSLWGVTGGAEIGVRLGAGDWYWGDVLEKDVSLVLSYLDYLSGVDYNFGGGHVWCGIRSGIEDGLVEMLVIVGREKVRGMLRLKMPGGGFPIRAQVNCYRGNVMLGGACEINLYGELEIKDLLSSFVSSVEAFDL